MTHRYNRAQRRADLRRMKAHARRVFYFQDSDRAERWANHLKTCSAACCGNPRKWYGELTMQEHRALLCEADDS